MSQLGALSMHYVSGRPDVGQSPETGFDCSGFVRHVLISAGLHIPDYIGMDDERRPIRHANEFWDHYGVHVHDDLRQPGDLVFFTRHGQFPTHIGIMLDAGHYIHAPGKDGTQVGIDYLTALTAPRHGGGTRLYGNNPIGYKSPVVRRDRPTYRFHQTPL